MIPWLTALLLCLGLLAGCGGGPKGGHITSEMPPPEIALESLAPEPEESLAEQLSAKRLEELYAKSNIPGWDPSLEEELKKWDHQVKFDVPVQMNRQVRAYLVYFSTERKEVIRRYLGRSSRYLPMIKETFQENGLPEDLAYLAMIESGFNNTACSHASAVGMWQFIRGTGLRYGLAIDSYVDERRDPEKATRAAAKYLLDLYQQFGSWYLAAASYNCGEGRVQKELNQSSHKNFWELSANECLPNETKNYVPQMIAATMIAKNPEKFGFKNVPYLPPLALDRLQVNAPTSLKAAASAINVPVEEIQALNPELTRGMTPPDTPSYSLKLPPKSKELFAGNIELARLEHPAVPSRPHRIAKNTGRYYPPRAAASRPLPAAGKANGKSKTVAKSAKKQTTQVAVAKKGKGAAGGKTADKPAPTLAAMFVKPAPAVKNGAPGGKKTGRQIAATDPKDTGRGKVQSQKSNGKKKPGKQQLTKKAESPARSATQTKASTKSASSTSRPKDNVSKAGPRPLLASASR